MPARQTIHVCNKEAEIAVLSTKVANVESMVQDIHHKLIGNGQPGVIADIKELKNMRKEFDETKKTVSDIEKKMWKFTGVVAVIVFLLSIIIPKIVSAFMK